jgi:hypothetical protein
MAWDAGRPAQEIIIKSSQITGASLLSVEPIRNLLQVTHPDAEEAHGAGASHTGRLANLNLEILWKNRLKSLWTSTVLSA